jgi:hypothetical protein
MVELPGVRPDTMPEPVPTVATRVEPEVHVPPVVASESTVVRPVHTTPVPVIASGNGFTVIGFVAIQPVGKVNVIVAVPAETAVSRPPVPAIVATPVLLLLHVDVPEISVYVVVKPAQTAAAPLMGDGNPLTVTVAVVIQPVGNV